MTGIDRNTSDAKAKDRDTAHQSDDAKARTEQQEKKASPPAHPVGNQGAPGGTCDDDGDSENQQDPTRRASRDPNER